MSISILWVDRRLRVRQGWWYQNKELEEFKLTSFSLVCLFPGLSHGSLKSCEHSNNWPILSLVPKGNGWACPEVGTYAKWTRAKSNSLVKLFLVTTSDLWSLSDSSFLYFRVSGLFWSSRNLHQLTFSVCPKLLSLYVCQLAYQEGMLLYIWIFAFTFNEMFHRYL